jgi:hypothetical protein
MKNGNDLFGNTSRLTAVSPEEQMLVEGGGILSSIWDAITDAAGWVMDNVFIDFGSRVIGWKGVW